MRIDVEAAGFHPEYVPQKVSGEQNELYNRGENVRGRIIDVNQNMVLIQTATGRQFSATTTIPIENYIDQEMSFAAILGADGEILLIPQIDEEKLNKQLDFKIEDILMKFGKQITPENKELVRQMMTTSIPITKENFEQLKSLKMALDILKGDNFTLQLEDGDTQKNIGELVEEMQTRKDFDVAKPVADHALPKEVGLKELLLLKNLNIKPTIQNLKALSDIFSRIDTGKTDITGIKSMLASEGFFEKIEHGLDTDVNSAFDNKNMDTKNPNVQKSAIETADFKSGEFEIKVQQNDAKINSFKFPQLSKLIKMEDGGTGIKGELTEKEIAMSEVMQSLKDVDAKLSKRLLKTTQNPGQELDVDYKTIKEELKTVSQILGKDNPVSQMIEKQIMPKLELLSNMYERYNFNIIPLQIQNQNTVLQFYKKKKNSAHKGENEPINIGLCLNTKNYGLVKTMLSYQRIQKTLNLDFYTQDNKTRILFQNNIRQLSEILKTIGFNSIGINVQTSRTLTKSIDMLDDVMYENTDLRSFEIWI